MKLVIETSNRQASILVDTGSSIQSIEMDQDHRQSSHLLPLVETHLKAQEVKPSDISEFYVHVGPGSSTGLRMGVAMAQGWAAVFPKVEFYGVYLEAMALEVLKDWNPSESQAYLLADAFAGQVFVQSFVKNGDVFEFDGELQLLDRSALEGLNPKAAIVDDLGFLKSKQSWPETWSWYEGAFPHANWVHLAGKNMTESSEIKTMDVRYLKATSAELNWQKKEKK